MAARALWCRSQMEVIDHSHQRSRVFSSALSTWRGRNRPEYPGRVVGSLSAFERNQRIGERDVDGIRAGPGVTLKRLSLALPRSRRSEGNYVGRCKHPAQYPKTVGLSSCKVKSFRCEQ
jgi:hypothetical protein